MTCDDLCKMTRSSYCLFPKTEFFVSGGGASSCLYPYTHSTYSTMGQLKFSDLAFCKVKRSIVTSLLPTSSNSHLAPSGSSTLEGQPPSKPVPYLNTVVDHLSVWNSETAPVPFWPRRQPVTRGSGSWLWRWRCCYNPSRQLICGQSFLASVSFR